MVQEEAPLSAIPLILEGKSYIAVAGKNLLRIDERSLEHDRTLYESEDLVAGIGGVERDAFLFSERPTNYGRRMRRLLRYGISSGSVGVVDNQSSVQANINFQDVVVDGFYVTTSGEGITCFSLGSFEKVWSFKGLSNIRNVAVSRELHRVVVYGLDRSIACLRLEDGGIIWHRRAAEIGALDKVLEKEVFQSGILGSYPHIFGDVIVCGSMGANLVGVDIKKGKLLWKQEVPGTSMNPCVDERGRVFVVSKDTLFVLDVLKGRLLDKKVLPQPDNSGDYFILDSHDCDITDTHLIVGTRQALLYAVNLDTGNIDWHQKLPGRALEGPVVVNNRVYARGQKLYVFEGANGYVPD